MNNGANSLEWVSISELKKYEKNSRTHTRDQIKKIAESIKTFGFTNPILVTGDLDVIAGHGRIEAANLLSMDLVPVIKLEYLTEEQMRALVIADNRIALDAGWNEEILAQELASLRDINFDLSLIGFSNDEIDKILKNIEDPLTAGQDLIPETPLTPISVKGDIWILGEHKVLCGDSTMLDDVEKLMGEEKADSLWTDPPYNVNYEGSAGKIQNDSMSNDSFRQFLRDAFITAFAVMKEGASAYIAHADTEGLNFRAAFIEAGFKLSGCLIWRKNSLVLGRSDYQWQHEPILYGWKPGAAHFWYGGRSKTTIQELDIPLFTKTKDNEWQISLGEETLIISGEAINVEIVNGSVFFEEKPKKNADHPTMKPVGLIERMLNNSTKKGFIVLDLFGGSGSTLMACQTTGRRARIVELDEKFVDVIVRRWQNFTGRQAIHSECGKTFTELEKSRIGDSRDSGE